MNPHRIYLAPVAALSAILLCSANLTLGQGPSAGSTTSHTWELGVHVRNTDLGAVITEMGPRGPAAGAGLEVGDTVLAVGARRVGYVDGILHDVADECARHAGDRGTVTLLVLTRRRGAVTNVSVKLRHTGDVITGVLTCPPGPLPPRGSWASVRILEQPRWKGATVEITRVSFPYPGGRSFEYRLPFDQRDIIADRRYTIDAWIANEGATFNLFQTPSPSNLPRRLDRARVDMALVRVAPPPGVGGTDVAGWFRAALGRGPDRADLDNWKLLLDRGVTRLEIRAQILASTEFFDLSGNTPAGFVVRLYQTVLSRTPNRDEVKHWLGRMVVNRGNRLVVTREFLRAAIPEKSGG
jgi:hypothetical protein